MNDPLVSIIIPTHARPQFLEQALRSVLIQTMPDWECIVVDDGAGTPAIGPTDERIRTISRAQTGGPGAARNTGIAAARGAFITFLDDDDLFVPTRLHAGLRGLTPGGDALSIVQLTTFDEHHVRTVTEAPVGLHRRNTQYRARFPQVGQVLLPRERAQLFDESFRTAEDAEWWLRVGQTGPVFVAKEVGYLLRSHPAARPGVDRRSTLENRVRLFQKHEGYLGQNRRAAAYAAARVAGAALALGERKHALRWAVRSLKARPNPRAALVARRALMGPKRTP